MAVIPDGRAISASSNGTLKVWNPQTGQEERTLAGHADAVSAVEIALDGRCAVSTSTDRTLRIWDLQTGQELATASLEGTLDCVAVAPDGVTIVAGDAAGNVYCLRYVEGDGVTG